MEQCTQVCMDFEDNNVLGKFRTCSGSLWTVPFLLWIHIKFSIREIRKGWKLILSTRSSHMLLDCLLFSFCGLISCDPAKWHLLSSPWCRQRWGWVGDWGEG